MTTTMRNIILWIGTICIFSCGVISDLDLLVVKISQEIWGHFRLKR